MYSEDPSTSFNNVATLHFATPLQHEVKFQEEEKIGSQTIV